MKILMPSIVDPAAHRGGAGSVTRALVELLARAPLQAAVEVLPLAAPRRHRLRQLASILRSLASALPAKAHFTRTKRLRAALAARLRRGDVDLLLLNGSDLLWMLPELPRALPRLVVAHNVEQQLYRAQLATVRPSGARPAFTRDLRKLAAYETDGLRAAGHALFLSHDDAAWAERACPGLRTLVIPPLFDYPPPAPPSRESQPDGLDLGLLANFGWWPNRQGLRWFLAEVFPRCGDDVRLHLFGTGSVEAAPRHSRIVAHGFVPRRAAIWPQCDLMLCPNFAGGGVSVKFAEAIHNGMPVLARPFATRGLALPADPAVVVLERADEWVRFLGSPLARALRTHPPAPWRALAFAVETHREAVQAFVRRTVGAAPPGPPRGRPCPWRDRGRARRGPPLHPTHAFGHPIC